MTTGNPEQLIAALSNPAPQPDDQNQSGGSNMLTGAPDPMQGQQMYPPVREQEDHNTQQVRPARTLPVAPWWPSADGTVVDKEG
jgi:hypothetical protein